MKTHGRGLAPLALSVATIGLLSACTSVSGVSGNTRATAPTAAAAPTPPAGASAGLTIPSVDAVGRYRTPNSDLGPAATIWHVRSALNVAALSCRGPAEATLIADYNRLLAGKRKLLAAAFARTEADTRAAGGKDWRDVHDRRMTQVYNFFAQPPAKAGFCAVAAQVAAEAAATPAADFPAFVATALPRLEAPFLDFYRAYDAYRRDLAAWQAGTRPATQLGYAPLNTVIGWSPAASPASHRLAAADPAP